MTRWFLNTSQHFWATCFSHSHSKKRVSWCSVEISLCPLHIALSLGTPEENLLKKVLPSLLFLQQVLTHTRDISWSILNTLGSLSPTLWEVFQSLPQTAVNPFPNTNQDTTHPFCHKGPLLAYAHLAVHQYSQVPFWQITFQQDGPQSEIVDRVTSPQVQDFVLSFIKFLKFLVSPSSSVSFWGYHDPLSYQLRLPVWCHLQTCWEYTLLHHPGHELRFWTRLDKVLTLGIHC